MMMITTRFILNFVKEIVGDLSYNPNRSPVPGIMFVPTLYLLCSSQNTDNLIPGAATISATGVEMLDHDSNFSSYIQ